MENKYIGTFKNEHGTFPYELTATSFSEAVVRCEKLGKSFGWEFVSVI